MNIFVLDQNPLLAAMYHHDKHVVKMVLESTQMLSTAQWLMGREATYKPTHAAHPCVRWLMESTHNYLWLLGLAKHLSKEYTHRYGREHACHRLIYDELSFIPLYPKLERTPFALAMPAKFIIEGDAVASYRNYYNAVKVQQSRWTNRPVPDWVENVHTE